MRRSRTTLNNKERKISKTSVARWKPLGFSPWLVHFISCGKKRSLIFSPVPFSNSHTISTTSIDSIPRSANVEFIFISDSAGAFDLALQIAERNMFSVTMELMVREEEIEEHDSSCVSEEYHCAASVPPFISSTHSATVR